MDIHSMYAHADFGSDETEPHPSRPPDIPEGERPPPERCKHSEDHLNSFTATENLPDKFLPFDDEDVDPVHMRRLSQAEILKLSDSELLSHFETGPLSHLNLGSNLTKDQMKALRVCVLENRDLFAINDKRPGKVNTSGFRIDTGDAPPQVYPSRPVMPRMRPIIQKQIDEMLKYGIIEHSTLLGVPLSFWFLKRN